MGGRKKNTRIVQQNKNNTIIQDKNKNLIFSEDERESVGNESISSDDSFFRKSVRESNESVQGKGMQEKDEDSVREELDIIDTSRKPVREEEGQPGAEGNKNDRLSRLNRQGNAIKNKQADKADVSDWVILNNANEINQTAPLEIDFDPVHTKRNKQGFFSKAYDDVTDYIGTTTGIIATLGTLPLLAPYTFAGNRKLKNAEKNMQEERNHLQIPGWNGATYAKKAKSGEDILADFRRVPTVWSYVTAGKAQKDDGTPVDPEITVYVDQPRPGSSVSLIGSAEMGHAMLGIRYSRFSKISGKYERYGLKYGFYPAGGFLNGSGGAMAGARDAIIPGELSDDRSHEYAISRTYPATARQVNDVVKASETYADKGYGYFSRNCTTFVKEMVVDVAHLDTGGSIFGQERINFNARNNAKRWIGITGSFWAAPAFRAGLARRSKETDMSYQSFGNKRVTKQDVRNFNETYNAQTKTVKRGYIPAATGENMRRKYGNNAGVLGSMKYVGDLGENFTSATFNLASIGAQINKAGDELVNVIKQILPAQYQDVENAPENVLRPLFEMGGMGYPMNDLSRNFTNYITAKNLSADTDEKYVLDPQDVQKAHAELTENVDMINNYYSKILGQDSRINTEVMNLLSLLNLGIEYVDRIYESMVEKRGKGVKSEIGNVRANMTERSYKVKADGVEASFTPSHYESYLQIFKDPKKAVKVYARYTELNERGSADKNALSKAEKTELKKLQRFEELANQFDQSHRYFLEAEGFNRDDIYYVLSLRKAEKMGGASGEMFKSNQSASGIYMSLMLGKMFAGMTERFKDPVAGPLPDKLLQKGDMNAAAKAIKKWLDKELTDCITKKQAGMSAIIMGIKNNDEGSTAKSLLAEVGSIIRSSYVDPAFGDPYNITNNREAMGQMFMLDSYDDLLKDSHSKFANLLKSLISEVLNPKKKMAKK